MTQVEANVNPVLVLVSRQQRQYSVRTSCVEVHGAPELREKSLLSTIRYLVCSSTIQTRLHAPHCRRAPSVFDQFRNITWTSEVTIEPYTAYSLLFIIIIIIIIIILTTTIFIVLSSTAPAICESSLRFVWAKVYAVDVGLLEPRVAVA